MENISSLKELFESENCQLLSTSVEELLKYKCCCDSEDIHEITYNNFLKGIRCNGYSFVVKIAGKEYTKTLQLK